MWYCNVPEEIRYIRNKLRQKLTHVIVFHDYTISSYLAVVRLKNTNGQMTDKMWFHCELCELKISYYMYINFRFIMWFWVFEIYIFQIDPSGEIILFASGGCPWKDHLFNIEAEHNITPSIKYCLFTDQNSNWRVQCVPLNLGSFDNRYVVMLRSDEVPT